MTSARRVTVTTGSRLHFGLLTHRPQSGREFGGVGVMIDAPGWKLTVSTSDDLTQSEHELIEDRITVSDDAAAACPETASRISRVIQRLRDAGQTQLPPLTVEVHSAIPSHRGLGSGTQLALATARAIDACFNMGNVPVSELARRTGRGLRSAVGTWGFESGGMIADGGKLHPDSVGSLAAAVRFPSSWRFLLIFPGSTRGLSGDEEVSAFRELPGMPQSTTNQLCQLTLMELLPAVHDHDFERASAAMSRYGRLAGEYFAPAQGGVFADAGMPGFSQLLADNGINGFAQSSWGPTCAALCQSDEMADKAIRLLRSLPETGSYEFAVAGALNHGAEVKTDT